MCDFGLNIGKDKLVLRDILGLVGKLEYGLSVKLYENKLKLKVKIINWIKWVVEWSMYYDFILVKKI